MKRAYAVHLLTASGIFPAGLAMHEVLQSDCDPRIVFLYLFIAILIDAVDGPLARRFDVKSHANTIDGRTIDDLLDYLTFAFIPLMLIWRMDWMPEPWGPTVMLAMGASLLGFAHREAKDESRGVFRGFPSYWNLYAVYAAVFSTQLTPWVSAVTLWVLTALTIMPVWVLYPNLAPRRWKLPIFLGGFLWIGCLAVMVWTFPKTSMTLTLLSLTYPLFYLLASVAHVRVTTVQNWQQE